MALTTVSSGMIANTGVTAGVYGNSGNIVSITVNSEGQITAASNVAVSIPSGNATLLKNRLIDAGFIINQRGYVSNTALSAGTYAHDRWKAGASGCTYTFTQGSLGVPIVITITAGSLQQIIEGCNMPDGGTFTLSWTGTAQGRVNGGTYGSSPLAVTGITAGANTTIEFNTGTLSFPQLEVGSSATGFEYRQYGQELALCQRYCYAIYSSGSSVGMFAATSTTAGQSILALPVTARVAPTGITASSNWNMNSYGAGSTPSVTPTFTSATANALTVNCSGGSGFVVGLTGTFYATSANGYIYTTGSEL